MTTLWDTNGGAIVKALAAERRSSGAVTSGLVLTLVAVADERNAGEAISAASAASTAHPCRVLVVVRRQPDAPSPRLDAEVNVGGGSGPGEFVVMRMYGRLALHAESVVLPLLAPDAPVVTWWYGAPPELIAHDPLGVLADRRVTDSAAAADPLAALKQRADDYYPGDTDLAWARLTGWRAVLAASFDAVAEPVTGGVVHAKDANPSAALLAGWLSSRLGTTVGNEPSKGPGVTEVVLELGDEDRAAAGEGAGQPPKGKSGKGKSGKSSKNAGDGGPQLRLSRPDGRTATLSRAGQPDRALPLPRRDLGDLLAEELRRLDSDEVYREALAMATGVQIEPGPVGVRTHIWKDPAQEKAS
ncbi:MAG: glucose-6-phosphate dehydrogenase assembly protein OpcA [Actinomycetota bacterium]|nr:glucose-6-phosphate dehydrogenase assembly protein OpcA [Actinomycetota bacterium]